MAERELNGSFRDTTPARHTGLPYAMADAGLMPDDRLATWVLAMADEK